MSKTFLTPIDLNKNEIRNAVAQVLSSAPSSPNSGQFYYDSTTNRLYYYNGNGTVWELKATNSDLLQGQNSAYHLSRTNHTGTQTSATISDLASVVQAYRLDQFAVPTADVSVNSHKVTNVATPTAGTDAANKSYVDSTVQGLSPKPTAQVATAAALPANAYSNGASGVGATLTASANAALTVDSYAVALNDLVLVKNEVASANNGLYTVTQVGDGTHPYILTRHVDMDVSAEFGGSFVPVENKGTTTANTLWLCNVNAPTVGTTAITFTQLNSATSYSQGNGISISANTISAVVQASAGLSVGGSGLALDTTIAVRKYAQAFGDGAATSYTITHSLNTQDVTVSVYQAASPFSEVECDVAHATVNTVTLAFAVAPTANQYRVVVHG